MAAKSRAGDGSDFDVMGRIAPVLVLLSCSRLFDIQALTSSRKLVRVFMEERESRDVFMKICVSPA